MENKVSITIMSNDQHDILRECLIRLQKYTDIPYEVILVDDNSSPSYKEEDFAGLGEITIVRMPKRSNCCNLRNIGMEMAKTEFVFWVDNDTMVNENWYKPMLDKMKSDPTIGLVGQPKDAYMIRKPFLPLTQREAMVEYQYARDYNHANNEADFITSYCVLVRKKAFRPIFCYNMPTPMVDPELGAVVKANGYKVVVTDEPINVVHMGSATPRPGGRNYLFYLTRNFTRWWKFWESKAPEIFELYKENNEVIYDHDANEPNRTGSMGQHGDYDKDYDAIPEQYTYVEP